MRIVVLGGAGIIGRAIAADLVQDADRVIVADMDAEAAKRTAHELGPAADPQPVDVTDSENLELLLAGSDACINSVNYYFNLDVMSACLAARVPYLDLGGLFHKTREQLKLSNDFQKLGLTAVLGMGSCPGVANVQAGWLAGMLDIVESVRIFNGSTIDRGDSLAAPYAIETILDEISMPAMVFRDGGFEERPPLGEEQHYLFPEPIGWSKAHLSLHSEVATIPLSFADKGIRECTFKITAFGYSDAAIGKLRFLAELGLASNDPIEVGAARVRPRDMLIAALHQLPEGEGDHSARGHKAVVTEIKGRIGAQVVELKAETVGGPIEGAADGAGKRLVSGPAAIVAKWLASGRLSLPGVWPPEQVIDPDPFFKELADRGFTTRLVRSEPLARPPE
ncbi:MAG: saccharopine dehydrogenase family protein [Anaerolineae bacterium]|nr:MAG: saccharopine dehydrogenase family protein [Anaerolineae bacterium]